LLTKILLPLAYRPSLTQKKLFSAYYLPIRTTEDGSIEIVLKASGKPKSIDKEYLMHDLSPEKSKRTE